MARFFLSYAREDEKAARDVKRLLEGHFGLRIWMDSSDLLPGQQWESQILEAIRLAEGAIFLSSINSLSKSSFVRRELDLLLERAERLQGSIFLIVVRLDSFPVEDERLRTLHWATFDPTDHSRLRDEFSKIKLSAFRSIEYRQKELDIQKQREIIPNDAQGPSPSALHPLAKGRLFSPDEMDIYINKGTKETFIFHGKKVDYAALDYLLYVPEDHSVLVFLKNKTCLDLGVKIQWLVRPYFLEADNVSIVRTADGKSIDGTRIPLRFALDGSHGKTQRYWFGARVMNKADNDFKRIVVLLGGERRAIFFARLFVACYLIFSLGLLACLAGGVLWIIWRALTLLMT
jgi:hypothetical protein